MNFTGTVLLCGVALLALFGVIGDFSFTSFLITAVLGAVAFYVYKARTSEEFVPVDKIKCGGVGESEVKGTIDHYEHYYDAQDASVKKRQTEYTHMVNNFYDLVTDFYEYGWGQSFHFAPRHKKESFEASIARHEMWLGAKLGLKPGQKVLDFGCGVGGPMRCIARFTGASVTGLNNNDYQIARGTKQNANANLSDICDFIKCDFLKVPVGDASYDAAFAIEATCHAPDKDAIYGEVFRCLKPGSYFGGYEWVVTDDHDPKNPTHVQIKEGIERGNALPDLVTGKDVTDALKRVGFEVIEAWDVAADLKRNQIPWYQPLDGSLSFTGFKHTKLGRMATTILVGVLETLKIAPKGTSQTQKMLCDAAEALVAGGKAQTFTPCYFFLARKPETR